MRARLLVISVLAVAAACTGSDNHSAASTTASPVVTSAPNTTTEVPATTTTTPAVAPSTTTTLAEPAKITRPATDPSSCEPQSAREGHFSDDTLNLFANSREAPIPIQIIGDPEGPPFVAFALVERFFTSDFVGGGGSETVEINGNQVRLGTFPNGNGNARWTLPDGSIAYLRSRGLDVAALKDIVGRLSPRDPAAAIPGFDFDDSTGARQFALLAEHLNTGVRGNVATVECISPATGFRYQVSAIDGEPIFEYGGVIDRPVPLEVGIQAGTLIVINGIPDPSAPTVSGVVDGDADSWAALLDNS